MSTLIVGAAFAFVVVIVVAIIALVAMHKPNGSGEKVALATITGLLSLISGVGGSLLATHGAAEAQETTANNAAKVAKQSGEVNLNQVASKAATKAVEAKKVEASGPGKRK